MMLSLNQVSKGYGGQIALNDITCILSGGPIALLGSNGSGKTTLLRLLATLEKPDGGTIHWNGLDYHQDVTPMRAMIGYLPQTLDLPDHLTPRRLLQYLALMRHLPPANADHLLDQMNLTHLADKRLSALSVGEQRLLGIAQALLGDPELLLLDEVGTGLDTTKRERIGHLIRRRNRLTIFSTHIPAEAERFAEGVIVLGQGRLRYAGTVASLCEYAAGRVYECRIAPDQLPQMSAHHSISRVMQKDDQLTVRVVGPRPGPDAVAVAPTLEDAYLLLIQQ